MRYALLFLFLVLTREAVIAAKIDRSLQLPVASQVDHITISPNSAMQWYTADSLMHALPHFIPRQGTYLTKLAFQRGTFTLKDGRILNWMAAAADSILLYSEKGEQLYELPDHRGDREPSFQSPNREQAAHKGDSDLFPIRIEGKSGFIDAAGNIVIPAKFNSDALTAYFPPEEYFHDGLAVAYDEEGGGFIDSTGNFVIKGHLRPQGPFAGDLARVSVCTETDMRTQECKLGFLDRQGKFVIPPQFSRGEDFSEGLAAVEINRKWGYINRAGKMEILPRFDTAASFQEGFARVEIRNVRQGWVSKTGKFLSMPDEVEDFDMLSEGLIAVKIQGKWGFIDTSGKLVIPAQFDPSINEYRDDNYGGAAGFSGGLAAAKLNGKWGYIDRQGNVVIKPEFDKVLPFDQDVAAVEMSGKWGYIRRNGELMISAQFDEVGHFHNGLAQVCANQKCGFLDMKGHLAIPLQFDDARDFSEGLAAVCMGGQWGYVDESGAMVIKPQFISGRPFHNGLALQISKEFRGIPSPDPGYHEEWGYIDRSGHWIWRTAE